MEYLPLGDLEHYLEAPLPESQACIISRQILQGLVFMHENKFAHRDMKPAVSTKPIYHLCTTPRRARLTRSHSAA